MFEDLRSPEAKAEAEAQLAAWDRKRKAAERKVALARKRFAGAWQPIKTCPLAAYDECYGEERHFLVTDGQKVGIVYAQHRFGTPMVATERLRMVMTDHGFAVIGGKLKKPDRPAWWFKFELKDLTSGDDGRFGRDEIDFVPTHWQPLPLPQPPEPSNV